MKNRLYSLFKYFFVLFFTFSISFFVQAQCTTCTFTVSSSSSASFTLNAGQRLCITGGTYSGTITINGNNAAICVGSSGTFSNSANINFNGTFSVIYDNSGSWQKNITIDNASVFNNLANFGTTASLNLTVQGGSVFNNFSNFGTASFPVNLSLNNTSTFNNFTGASAFTSNINSNANATVNNFGIFRHSSSLSWNGTWINKKNSDFRMTGDLNVNAGSSFTNEANSFMSVTGNVNNNALLLTGGNLQISGTLTNNGSGTLAIQDSNISASVVTNNGLVEARGRCGKLSIANGSVQNGSGVTTGVGGALIDICDATHVGATYDINFNSGGTTNTAAYCTCNPVNSLPVDFVFFRGEIIGKQIRLFWQTAKEENNSYFTIERSSDGQHFETLKVIEAAGNTSQIHNYRTFDEKPLSGLNYYRLSQTDNDGTKKAFNKTLSIRMDGKNLLISPNPTHDGKIKIALGESFEELKITVYNLQGKTVLTQNLQNTQPETDFNLGNLPKGTYLLRFTDANATYQGTYRIVLL